jgi:hypothetical protein
MDALKRYRELVVMLFIAALLALNYPLQSQADHRWLVLGIPRLYLDRFLVWLLLIIARARITWRRSRGSVDDD